jgi:hypothetical protein
MTDVHAEFAALRQRQTADDLRVELIGAYQALSREIDATDPDQEELAYRISELRAAITRPRRRRPPVSGSAHNSERLGTIVCASSARTPSTCSDE